MIPSNRVQAVIHHSQSVDGTLCVHVLFAGPDIHDGVITIQPWHILSIVHTPCERQTHRSQGSASRDGFVKKNREMACLKYIFSHCALLLHGLPEAEAKRTHSATRWCPSCSTPHWTGSQFHSSRQSRINACPSGMRRNWLFYKEGTALSKSVDITFAMGKGYSVSPWKRGGSPERAANLWPLLICLLNPRTYRVILVASHPVSTFDVEILRKETAISVLCPLFSSRFWYTAKMFINAGDIWCFLRIS